MLPLIKLCVDQKTEPECLQHPEDKAFFAVKKAQPEHVAVEKQSEWAHEQRGAVVMLPPVALLLDRVAGAISLHTASRCLRRLFLDFVIGPAVVARRPFGKRQAEYRRSCSRKAAPMILPPGKNADRIFDLHSAPGHFGIAGGARWATLRHAGWSAPENEHIGAAKIRFAASLRAYAGWRR